ncbi:MAG: hypothetical protein IIX94_00215 [Clostridia bacterium]|nr:hypothetical protein [Clostridia bacterium]
MKTEKNENRLRFFEALYEAAKDAQSELSDSHRRNMDQYRGSADIDGSSEKASCIRNITYELVEAQVSSHIPAPKVEAREYSEKSDRNAKSVERLCALLRDMLPFEEMNDIDERYTYIYGSSVWFVEWDNGIEEKGEKGGVRISCLNPDDFFPQPNICDLDDMEYCFLRFHTTKSELERKYGISKEAAALAETEAESNGSDEADTVTVIHCFYKNEENAISEFAFSGEVTLVDIENYYKRKEYYCKTCGRTKALCECEAGDFFAKDVDFEFLSEDIKRSDGSVITAKTPRMNSLGELLSKTGVPVVESELFKVEMENTRLPYYLPKHFPIIIRKNTSKDNSPFGQSDCEFIRPQQQQINKLESRIMQKLLRAGITPIVPEDAQVSLNNSVFGQVIKLKPGESVGMYGTIDNTPSIAQDVLQSDRLYEHAKRIIGISDTYIGLSDDSAMSGKAKQLQIDQAAGRLESKRRMKHSAYARIDRIIFEYYLAYADEPRRIAYKDAYGRTHNAEFNRYDFIEFDVRTGEYYYDDSYLFSVDLNDNPEKRRELLWEKNLENLKAGTLGNPEEAITLLRYWQNQERAHYPHARENVEYFRSLIKEREQSANELQEEKESLNV